MTTAGARPLRKDAQANRERILDHAEKVLHDVGLEISLHRIAEELGMGIGTVYRHFPTRDELFLGIHQRLQERLDTERAALSTLDDPYDRVLRFIDTTITFSLEHPYARAVSARVGAIFPESVRVSPASDVIARAVTEAQHAGRIRDDVNLTDIATLAGMLADLVWIEEPARSALVQRMRSLALDSIAPAMVPRDALPSVEVSPEDLRRIVYGIQAPS